MAGPNKGLSPENITEFITALEDNVFPLYHEAISNHYKMILDTLHSQGMEKDNVTAGLINGMALVSFELSVKWSLMLFAIMSEDDFDPTDPTTMDLLKQMVH